MWNSEWIAVAYFAYLAAACWLQPVPFTRRLLLGVIGLIEIVLIVLVARHAPLVVRQWAPGTTILVGYYASGLLFTSPSTRAETWLIAWDRRLLGDPTTRFASWPRIVIAALEIAYMGCFILIPAGLLILVLNGHGEVADRYWTLVVAAEFGSFAPLAFLQTRPPWALERKPVLADRAVHDVAAKMVNTFTIRANTFPSGHVAGSLAVAIAVGEVLPPAGAALFGAAAIIALATIVGRYHYCIDALAAVVLVGVITLAI